MFFAEGPDKPYKHTLREIRHDHLLNFSEESLFEGTDRTFSKVYVELPYPTHIPFRTSEDLVQKLLKDKANYNNLQESIRKRYTRYDKNNMVKEKYNDHTYINLPQYLINWYDEKDPDRSFSSDYNYYYTDGNLEHFQYKNNDYLIRPDLDNKLCITNARSDEDVVNDIIRMDYSSESTIYNINSTQTNNGLHFVLREKHQVSILKLKKHFKVSLRYAKKHKQPLLDAKLSADGKLGFIYPNSKFSIKDIESDYSIISFKNDLSEEVDTFQQFRFLNENTVVIMDRKKIRVIDIRSKSEEMCFEPKLLKCNGFYNFITLDNTLLAASRHYLLKTDFRCFDDTYHYSHSLSDPPCYLDYTLKDSDTYLTVSGQHYDSRVLFTGRSPYSLPFKIPSLKKTLTESRLNYPPLVMEHHLDKRLLYSVTGLKMLNLDGDINIFTSNCFGEIFKQKVFESKPSKSKPIEAFCEWSKTLDKPQPILYLTHFEDISDVRNSLNKKLREKHLTKYKKTGNAKKFLETSNKIYSSKRIKSQLGKDFVSIWEESDEESEEEIEDLPKEEAYEKVNNWIQIHDFNKDEETKIE